MGWQPEGQPERVGIIKLYIQRYPLSVMTSKCPLGQGPSGLLWILVKNLLSRKQRCKAMPIEAQHGLRKGQYSSPLTGSICLLHLPVSVSHLCQFGPFQELIKRDVYFCKEHVTISSFLHYVDMIYNIYCDWCRRPVHAYMAWFWTWRLNTGQSKKAVDEGRERKKKRDGGKKKEELWMKEKKSPQNMTNLRKHIVEKKGNKFLKIKKWNSAHQENWKRISWKETEKNKQAKRQHGVTRFKNKVHLLISQNFVYSWFYQSFKVLRVCIDWI